MMDKKLNEEKVDQCIISMGEKIDDILSYLDQVTSDLDADRIWSSIAKTHFQDAFVAFTRSMADEKFSSLLDRLKDKLS